MNLVLLMNEFKQPSDEVQCSSTSALGTKVSLHMEVSLAKSKKKEEGIEILQ